MRTLSKHISPAGRPVSAGTRKERHAGLVLFVCSLVLSVLALPCVIQAEDMLDPDSFGPRLSSQAAKPIAPSRFEKGKKARVAKAPAEAFTMGRAVRHALDYNPSAGASEAAAKASEEGRKAALGELFPELSTSYSYGYQRQDRDPGNFSNSQPADRGTFTWNIQVRQILFDGFRTLGTYQKQALQAESDRASLRQSELETTGSVQESFISYLCAVENVRSQREAVARLADQLDITQAFHDVGLRPMLDVLQARVDLGDAQRELITQENTRDTSLAELNTLLGYAATQNVQYKGALVTRPFKRSLEECLERAYRMRPDLYVGYKAVEMAVKDRLIARAGYYPQIEAYYSINANGNTPDLQRAGNNGSRSTTWEVGASLSWEVFQWGTTYFSDQQAGWLVSRARSQARELMLNAGLEVKQNFLSLREANKRIDVARQNVAHAREAYEAALAQYREQVGTNFDVLDASSNLLSAEVALTAARGDYLTALSRLYRAMGEFHPELL